MQHTVINNYHIQSELGRGGMAVVYLAHDKKFNTNVAIKVLNKEFLHNENIRKRFLSEARNMFRMSHPNIIRVTDLIEEGDTVAFVMEYIDGETLKEHLERKSKLNDEEIKHIFTQMLDALEYVHEQDLVHRDIKPSNFMITSKGKVKLLDFGIAKNTDASSAEYTQTGTGVQMGTPMYMSPEQITETKSVTAQSDIYSLGVVLWQMVSGRKPYDTQILSNYKLQNKIVNEPLDDTNTQWDPIIQKATEKEVEKRFVSCQLFLEALRNSQHSTSSDHTVVASPSFEQTIVAPERIAAKTDAYGIQFCWVEGGTFEMGTQLLDDEKPIHKVTLEGYYMSKYPVTQAQWVKVMGTNPSHFKANGSDCPVENISWKDCQLFIEKINKQLGCKYRLPTEAEWEFAARGGIKSKGYKYAGSNNIEEVAWYNDNRVVKIGKSIFWALSKIELTQYLGTHPVGKKKDNELGLHDMTGNVREWCSDKYRDYPTSSQTNPQGPSSGSFRVNRGGSWLSYEKYCRSSYRYNSSPDFHDFSLGFRLVSPQ